MGLRIIIFALADVISQPLFMAFSAAFCAAVAVVLVVYSVRVLLS